MFSLVVLVILLIGVNTIVWSSVGLARVVASRRAHRPSGVAAPGSAPGYRIPQVSDVAVVIAAHNEEMVIGNTLRSLEHLVKPSNIFVVSDGSKDKTAAIARRHGAQVLELLANRGKAGAIVEILSAYRIADSFEVVMLLDADTQLTPGYFETGLPLFSDPGVVAVAGRASTLTATRSQTRLGRLLVAYRDRVYIAMQYLFKYGQAARRANVVSIVPGFASMYRSRVLDQIDIAAPGLKIEDYNMTFEIHAKKLGAIAFNPQAAIAVTQDPDKLGQYISQVERWNLGFWQTVGRHRFRFEKFWLSLSLFIVELTLSSVVLILLVPALLISLTAAAITALGVDPSGSSRVVTDLLPPVVIILGILIPDFLLTVLAAIVARKPQYLLLGLYFPLLRILDATLCLRALFAALGSDTAPQGKWKSPERRSIETVPASTLRPGAVEVKLPASAN
ncbi:MAG: glycosyl transferase [Glaciihabitans sp.]|nr:glycosyl transferase [Glaciihabitans sp.]